MGTALLLESMGFKCDQALNGFDALDRFKAGKYGAILMDYEMQGMNGAQCTDTIRKLEATTGARTPVIGLTSHNQPDIIRECLESSMDTVLPKDCQSKELFDVLETLMFARSKN